MPRLVTRYDAEVVNCAGGIGAMLAEQNAARQRANAASLAAACASAAAASSSAAADALGVPLHARVMGLAIHPQSCHTMQNRVEASRVGNGCKQEDAAVPVPALLNTLMAMQATRRLLPQRQLQSPQ